MTDNIKRFHSNLYAVADLQRTAEFYKKIGFNVAEFEDVVRIKIDDFTLAFMNKSSMFIDKEVDEKTKSIELATYVEVNDVDVQYKSITSNGILSSSEPKSFPWGKREFTVNDPDGYKIVFYSAI